MDDEEQEARSHTPDCIPPFFVRIRIRVSQSIGIIKRQRCGFKSNPVLCQVAAVLLFIPLESHGRFQW
jgi:hypothetical protein